MSPVVLVPGFFEELAPSLLERISPTYCPPFFITPDTHVCREVRTHEFSSHHLKHKPLLLHIDNRCQNILYFHSCTPLLSYVLRIDSDPFQSCLRDPFHVGPLGLEGDDTRARRHRDPDLGEGGGWGDRRAGCSSGGRKSRARVS